MSIPKKVRDKLGTLIDLASLTVAEAIRQRGGTAKNVRQTGHWAEKTVLEAATEAVSGDPLAVTAIKIVKDARRLGEKY
ncbi:MAG: hypothetical protein K2X38_23460 [Gemmataceae bacterium]|nr:hypothetical protein [Gemmataceae bacterium]